PLFEIAERQVLVVAELLLGVLQRAQRAVVAQGLDEVVVSPVVVGIAPARRRRGERGPRVQVVVTTELGVLVDQDLGHLTGRRLGPVRQLDRTGDPGRRRAAQRRAA